MESLGSIHLFRITHIGNLPRIITAGKICCPNHAEADKEYISIGHRSIIGTRDSKAIPKGPGGTFRDYVSFYFGSRGPMLYSIKFGNGDVEKLPMSRIIYLVTSVERVKDLPFVFTDGQGIKAFTRFFDDIDELGNVDLDAAKAKYWNEEDDPDLKRRKQSEFLVFKEVPFDRVSHILAYDNTALAAVNTMLVGCSHQPRTMAKPDFYF
jgi:hypothetical protein